MEARTTVTGDGVCLHVGVCGFGPDVVVLSGGPGCVHYLEAEHLAPGGFRCWYPEPRGVGRSGGGPHDLARAVADLEEVRRAAGVVSWTVLGHSWGSDLAVRYALDHPDVVEAVVGVAGRGLQLDREWSAAYEAGRDDEPGPDVAFDTGVWESLRVAFAAWVHEPGLFRALADSPVPMRFVAAADDVRPSWPMAQLAALVPGGALEVVPGVPHDFWATHPATWVEVVTRACREVGGRPPRG